MRPGVMPSDNPRSILANSVSHVLAATDLSNASVAAAQTAADWARALSAKPTFLHVVEPPTVPPQWLPLVQDSDETRAATARAKLHALAEEIGSQHYEEVVASGRPAEVITSIALDREAQRIVMGLGSEQGAFAPRPGSIAYRVLSSATLPVLVVPPR